MLYWLAVLTGVVWLVATVFNVAFIRGTHQDPFWRTVVDLVYDQDWVVLLLLVVILLLGPIGTLISVLLTTQSDIEYYRRKTFWGWVKYGLFLRQIQRREDEAAARVHRHVVR